MEDRMESMAEEFLAFADSRINTVVNTLRGTPAGWERARRVAEVNSKRQVLVERLGGDRDAASLIDELEMALSGVVSIDLSFAFSRGLEDGVRLAEIFDGKVVRWLADAYVPAGEEKEDGEDV